MVLGHCQIKSCNTPITALPGFNAVLCILSPYEDNIIHNIGYGLKSHQSTALFNSWEMHIVV